MKKKLFIIILLSSLLSLTLNTLSTSAITPQSYANVSSIVYYEDDALNTPITVNTLNLSNTPIIWHSMTGASSYRLSRFRFNLNQSVGLSRTRRLIMSFEVKTQLNNATGTEGMGAYFSCPRGKDDIVISECAIKDLETNQTTWVTEPSGNGEGSFPILSNKTYVIDLVFYNKSDDPVQYNYIDTMSRLLLFTNESTAINQISWQIAFNNVAVFSYEQSDTIPYILQIKEILEDYMNDSTQQQEQEAQDRTNIEDQQTDIQDEAGDQEDDASQTGTTLMGAFSGLITALGNMHTTNCRLPNMQIYSLELKNLNLCTVSMPSGISALGGIAISLLIVKLGISLVKRMLALYKEIVG